MLNLKIYNQLDSVKDIDDSYSPVGYVIKNKRKSLILSKNNQYFKVNPRLYKNIRVNEDYFKVEYGNLIMTLSIGELELINTINEIKSKCLENHIFL